MTQATDSFAILEISPDASDEQIKQAYRDLAQVWHPDRYQNNARLRAKAEERLKLINTAYQALCAERKGGGAYYRPAAPARPTPPPPPAEPASHTPPRHTWMPKDPPRGGGQSRREASTHGRTAPFHQPPAPGLRRKIVLGLAIVLIGLAAFYAKQVIFSKGPSQVRVESLAELKTRIALMTQDKDRRFDLLEQWYRRGVTPGEEAAYRSMLQDAQAQERQLETMIAAYNARKRADEQGR